MTNRSGSRKEWDSAYKKDRRMERASLVSVHNEAVKLHGSVGFRAIRIGHGGERINLPPYYAKILKACQELMNNRFRFKRLRQFGGSGMNNKRTRRNVSRVLAVLAVRSEFVDGRIGVAGEYGIETISHHSLMCDYVLRFGETIEESSWHNAIAMIKNAGYLDIQQIKLKAANKDGEFIQRSLAAYKVWSSAFFDDLKITMYPNVAKEILANRRKNEAKGYCFKWVEFYRMVRTWCEAIGIPTGLSEMGQYTLPTTPPH